MDTDAQLHTTYPENKDPSSKLTIHLLMMLLGLWQKPNNPCCDHEMSTFLHFMLIKQQTFFLLSPQSNIYTNRMQFIIIISDPASCGVFQQQPEMPLSQAFVKQSKN